MKLSYFWEAVVASVVSRCDPMNEPTRLLCPWNFPGKNAGVSCHFLLQGIFPIQGWSSHLLHWQASSLPLGPSF